MQKTSEKDRQRPKKDEKILLKMLKIWKTLQLSAGNYDLINETFIVYGYPNINKK